MATRHVYGAHPDQWADLYLPDRRAETGVAVVIHGGFWRSRYDASLGAPLAAALADRGYAAWNLEYRRVGAGGGYPETLHDVAAGIDLLRTVDGLDLSRVVPIGHSAGGQLAVWAAGPTATPRRHAGRPTRSSPSPARSARPGSSRCCGRPRSASATAPRRT